MLAKGVLFSPFASEADKALTFRSKPASSVNRCLIFDESGIQPARRDAKSPQCHAAKFFRGPLVQRGRPLDTDSSQGRCLGHMDTECRPAPCLGSVDNPTIVFPAVHTIWENTTREVEMRRALKSDFLSLDRMMSISLFWFTVPLIVLLLIGANAAAGDDPPDVFEYRFPHVKPIRIYSGTVWFAHKEHIVEYRIGCVRCHHTLEFGSVRVDTHCRECHTAEGFPRFEEAERLSPEERNEHYLVALHAQCVGCHIDVRQHQGQSNSPISCTRCHLR